MLRSRPGKCHNSYYPATRPGLGAPGYAPRAKVTPFARPAQGATDGVGLRPASAGPNKSVDTGPVGFHQLFLLTRGDWVVMTQLHRVGAFATGEGLEPRLIL